MEDSKAKDEEEVVDQVEGVGKSSVITVAKQGTLCEIVQTPHIPHVSIDDSFTM